MELKPFNISVLHVSPGAVKSNIASSGAARFSLAPNTLYSEYLPDIMRRINASQGAHSMSGAAFAKKVVASALSTKPPRYMTLGGNAGLFSFFKWLPRGLVLLLLWRKFSRK
jgi:short-subunit dehydrogenase